jgi:hypothetical protein
VVYPYLEGQTGDGFGGPGVAGPAGLGKRSTERPFPRVLLSLCS